MSPASSELGRLESRCMTSESDPVRENNPAPNAARESDIQANHGNPDILPTPGVSSPPPTETHYKITCKAEKDWWDKLKPFVEILGIALLAIYTAYTIKMYRANKQAAEAAKSNAATADATLKEIQKGGTDTHDLAVAAGKQANAAKSAADTAARSLELSERPWVSIDNKSLFITKPLTFNSNSASMYIGYSWKNTGHSPAMHIHSKNKLIVLSMTRLPEAEAAERQAALCDPLRKIPRWFLEITIFPDDTFPFNEGLGLDQGEIAAGLKSRESGPAAHPGYISLALVGCIDYQFSFAPEHHQTRYAFWVGITGPPGLWKADLKPDGVQPDVKLIYMSQSAD